MEKSQYILFIAMHILLVILCIFGFYQIVNVMIYTLKHKIYTPLLIIFVYMLFWVYIGIYARKIVEKVEKEELK